MNKAQKNLYERYKYCIKTLNYLFDEIYTKHLTVFSGVYYKKYYKEKGHIFEKFMNDFDILEKEFMWKIGPQNKLYENYTYKEFMKNYLSNFSNIIKPLKDDIELLKDTLKDFNIDYTKYKKAFMNLIQGKHINYNSIFIDKNADYLNDWHKRMR